jgi:AraC family transcriptional regulator, regulatory protein of adaptative response / methylated-DNA-[protein]-cysteine methyltransferase
MPSQHFLNYNRIAEAILYIDANFKQQPNLDDIAKHIGLSPFHFQKLFTAYCGISPKQFLQYTTAQYAKSIMQNQQDNLFSISLESGYSSSSRMHDAFVKLESMTPNEYKNRGAHLTIQYSFADTLFGTIIIATTPKGICYLAFINTKNDSTLLFENFPNAQFTQASNALHLAAIDYINNTNTPNQVIQLHLKGTPFQLKVWSALLQIPLAQLKSYGQVANEINTPKASRAVGTAIGSNPIAYIIPCHRVLQSTGAIGGYMWGTTRKKIIIAKEASGS